MDYRLVSLYTKIAFRNTVNTVHTVVVVVVVVFLLLVHGDTETIVTGLMKSFFVTRRLRKSLCFVRSISGFPNF